MLRPVMLFYLLKKKISKAKVAEHQDNESLPTCEFQKTKYIKININLNFELVTSFWWLKSFYEGT